MNNEDRKPALRRYEPPAVERVVLDPIKEMLTVCDPDPTGKNTTACQTLITSLS